MKKRNPIIYSDGVMFANDFNLENEILGNIIASPEIFVKYSGLLTKESFYNARNQEVYEEIVKANANGRRADLVYLAASLSSDQESVIHVANIASRASSMSDVGGDIELLEELRKKREAQMLGLRLISSQTMESEDILKHISRSLTKIESGAINDIKDKFDVIDDIVNVANENYNAPEGSLKRSTMTGFSSLDIQGGLIGGTLIVLSASTSTGKTAFAMSMLSKILEDGGHVGIYSMEMNSSSIGSRLLNVLGMQISNTFLRSKRLLEDEMYRLYDSARKLRESPGNFYIDDSSKTNIQKIVASIRRLKREKNISGVIIDYIQILNVWSDDKKGNEEKKLADAARILQSEAKALDIWIFVLSQLSRPPKTAINHVPTQDLIRGSGQIAEACDISLSLYRPSVHKEYYPSPFESIEPEGTAMLSILKYRDGECKDSIIGFSKREMRFYEFDNPTMIPRCQLPAHMMMNGAASSGPSF